MPAEIKILMGTALFIGFFHTITGPDHYLPFIMMSKARRWSTAKTAWLTVVCGLGHVLSSIVLGFIGVTFGIALIKLEIIESFRGDLAAWLLMIFGFVYFVWGIWRAMKNKKHTHVHMHEDGNPHEHVHSHHDAHMHVHEGKRNITPWVLFTIFIFGPCEPLIPILMYPAVRMPNAMTGQNIVWLSLIVFLFAAATIGTMLAMVMISLRGLSFLPLKRIERYTHAVAGATILLCGVSIIFLGL